MPSDPSTPGVIAGLSAPQFYAILVVVLLLLAGGLFLWWLKARNDPLMLRNQPLEDRPNQKRPRKAAFSAAVPGQPRRDDRGEENEPARPEPSDHEKPWLEKQISAESERSAADKKFYGEMKRDAPDPEEEWERTLDETDRLSQEWQEVNREMEEKLKEEKN